MKTSRPKPKYQCLIILVASMSVFASPAWAFNTLDCLRDLMPLTERGNFQPKRSNVEPPFFVDGGFLVFPEVVNKKLVGFFFYKGSKAWHFDAVKSAKGKTVAISNLKFSPATGMLQLVAQPEGLETVSLPYLPGYNPTEDNRDGAVVLGTSVLPVVGALVSRPDRAQLVYQDPRADADSRLKAWIHANSTGRRPAAVEDVKINKTIFHMLSLQSVNDERLWQPLKEELRLRQSWIKTSNLDEATFRKFNGVLQTSCKE